MREARLKIGTSLGEKCGERDRVRDDLVEEARWEIRLETTLGENRGERDRVRDDLGEEARWKIGLET